LCAHVKCANVLQITVLNIQFCVKMRRPRKRSRSLILVFLYALLLLTYEPYRTDRQTDIVMFIIGQTRNRSPSKHPPSSYGCNTKTHRIDQEMFQKRKRKKLRKHEKTRRLTVVTQETVIFVLLYFLCTFLVRFAHFFVPCFLAPFLKCVSWSVNALS